MQQVIMTLPPHVSAAVQQTDVTPEDELTCITFTPAAPSRLHIHNLTVETNCSISVNVCNDGSAVRGRMCPPEPGRQTSEGW